MKMKDKAVSEVVGAIILLMMAVSVFSVIYMNVLADDGPDPSAFVIIIGNVDGNNLILTHQRGESLSLDTEISLNSDIINDSFCVKDYLDDDSKEDGEWNIGEKVIYDNFPLNISNIRNYFTCNLKVLDKETNSLVFWGILDLYPEVDIGVTITADKEYPRIGDKINLTIIVTNNQKDADAKDIEIQYLLPDSLKYDYCSAPISYNITTGIFNISQLERNSSVYLNISAWYVGVSEPAQLAIILDGSVSIDDNEWVLMKNGLADAVRYNMPHDGSVEFTVVQFANNIPGGAQVEVGPIIVTEANHDNVADLVLAIFHKGGHTPLAAGIHVATNALLPNHNQYTRQIINIVTDGETNWPGGVAVAKEVAGNFKDQMEKRLDMDLNEDEIDVLGIGINNYSYIDWLKNNIVWPQPGDVTWPPTKPGWIREVHGYNDFPDAINEIFWEFFDNSCISNNVKIIAVTPKTDPNLENNKNEFILKV